MGDEHLVIIVLVKRVLDGVGGARFQPDRLGVQIKPKSTLLGEFHCEARCDGAFRFSSDADAMTSGIVSVRILTKQTLDQ